ncbi:MAG: hypothetical protein QW261_00705 [Candidatus Jordarchaeaceae archaeon]
MAKRKYKFEISDPETNSKLTLTLEGKLPPQLVASMIEDLSRKLSSAEREAVVSANSSASGSYISLDSLSMKEKVEIVLLKCFKHGWFTSNDVHEQYTNLFREELPLSTISTYLARIFEDSEEPILERSGTRKQYRYRLIAENVKDKLAALSQIDYIFT